MTDDITILLLQNSVLHRFVLFFKHPTCTHQTQ